MTHTGELRGGDPKRSNADNGWSSFSLGHVN